jgi:predicted nuclease of predicted toxin-antitoxin system
VRFFLDENVDARVRSCFTDRGHTCWTVPEANLASEADPSLTLYADDRDAVLVTHDKEFSQSRRKRIVGRHVYLNCFPLDAREVVRRLLPDIEPLLERHPDLYIAVSKEGFVTTWPNETWATD